MYLSVMNNLIKWLSIIYISWLFLTTEREAFINIKVTFDVTPLLKAK